jgi:uncharacterized protein (DUF885 family)
MTQQRTMKKLPLLILAYLIVIGCSSKLSSYQKSNWKGIRSDFEKGFKNLHLPPFELGYVQNLEHIQRKDFLRAQEQFFNVFRKSLRNIDPKDFTEYEKLDFEIMQYEIALHLERIGLEKKWLHSRVDGIPKNGLSTIPNGKEWYAYFLKKWVDVEVTPDAMFKFGLKEIARVASAMKAIQEKSGMDSIAFREYTMQPSFFYHTLGDVQEAFENTQKRVADRLENYFPYLEKIPNVTIARGMNKALTQAPAYYNPEEKTFYYNYLEAPYSKRQVSWIYIHEAMPGHHYQMSLEKDLPRSPVMKMFEYNGFREGYAAYVEEIGYELNAYQTIYDELGKWEWDLIRSVRVSLDVGLNYYNWSDEKALLFWQQYIKGKDDIAAREIIRMKRWPAQVISYKYGADKILQWKELYESKGDFNPKEFHRQILENGSIPFLC